MSVYRRDYKEEVKQGSDGSGSWAYKFTYRKIQYRKAGFKNKREAMLAEEKARKDVILEGKVLRPFQMMKFEDVGKLALSVRKSSNSPLAKKCDNGRMKVLNRYFGNRNVHTITDSDITTFIETRQGEGLVNRTINLDLNLLRVVMAYAVKKHYATCNPTDGIKNLPEPIKDRECMSLEEYGRLIKAAAALPNPTELVAWVMTSACTGMRPSEVLFLEWTDIYFDQDKIYVRPKNGNPLKTGMFRVVPLHPELKPILLKWKEEWDKIKEKSGHNHNWIFIYPADPSIRAQGFRRSFAHACKDAKVVPKSRYEFRHFFISQAVMQGIDLLTIARWVGHSSPQMIYKYYGHLSPDWQGKQMEKLKLGV